MTCNHKWSALIIIFKIVVQRSIDIRALFMLLVFLQFHVAHANYLEDIALPVIRSKYVRRFLEYRCLILIDDSGTRPHVFIVYIADWFRII